MRSTRGGEAKSAGKVMKKKKTWLVEISGWWTPGKLVSGIGKVRI